MKGYKVRVEDYHDGVKVSKPELAKWHEDALKAIINGSKSYAVSSGNGMVWARKNEETGEITVVEINTGYLNHVYTPI